MGSEECTSPAMIPTVDLFDTCPTAFLIPYNAFLSMVFTSSIQRHPHSKAPMAPNSYRSPSHGP